MYSITRKWKLVLLICVLFSSVVLLQMLHNLETPESEQRGDIPQWLIDTETTPRQEVTPDGTDIPCIGSEPGQVDDIFCMKRPNYLENYKNPCWYDRGSEDKLQCLPFFHILGVSKAGTTDLFSRIMAHADIRTFRKGKECQYWNRGRYGFLSKDHHALPFSWYVDLFANAADAIENHVIGDNYHPLITGDGSVLDFHYLNGWKLIPQNAGLKDPKIVTPHLMKHLYRDPKFILLLRNPTERLYSDYYYNYHGKSAQDFHNTVMVTLNVHQHCLRNQTLTQCIYSHQLPIALYLGCYSVHMRQWLRVFPRRQFLILKTEEYHNDIEGTLRHVYGFLDLAFNDSFVKEVSQRTKQLVTGKKNRAGPMLNETKQLLDSFYASFIRDLADILQDKRFLWRT